MADDAPKTWVLTGSPENDAETRVGAPDHIAKWPAEHWTLAFEGQLRTVDPHDTAVLLERLRAAAGVHA